MRWTWNAQWKPDVVRQFRAVHVLRNNAGAFTKALDGASTLWRVLGTQCESCAMWAHNNTSKISGQTLFKENDQERHWVLTPSGMVFFMRPRVRWPRHNGPKDIWRTRSSWFQGSEYGGYAGPTDEKSQFWSSGNRSVFEAPWDLERAFGSGETRVGKVHIFLRLKSAERGVPSFVASCTRNAFFKLPQVSLG